MPYHFSDINWAQGQNMSHLINCQCINGCLKTLGSKLKLVSKTFCQLWKVKHRLVNGTLCHTLICD